jgi:hypothetical protein
MSLSGDEEEIREAFSEVERVKEQLIVSVMQDDGNQTAEYVMAMAMGSAGGLLDGLGIEEKRRERLLRFLIVERWLGEASLKYLVFSLFLLQKDAVVARLRGGVSLIFGEYATIAAHARVLADEFRELLKQEENSPNNLALDFRQREIYCLSFTASEDIEKQRQRYPIRPVMPKTPIIKDASLEDAFRLAETVREKLYERTSQALATDGQQIAEDFQTLAMHGVPRLLRLMLLDQAEIRLLLQYNLVNQWITEICLKHLVFLIFLGNRDELVSILHGGLSRLFGERYVMQILMQTSELADEATWVMGEAMQSNPNRIAMPQRMYEIISLSLTASEDLENQHLSHGTM